MVPIIQKCSTNDNTTATTVRSSPDPADLPSPPLTKAPFTMPRHPGTAPKDF